MPSRPADLDPLDAPDHLVPRPSQLHPSPSTPGAQPAAGMPAPAPASRRGRVVALLIVLLGAALALGVPIVWHLTHL